MIMTTYGKSICDDARLLELDKFEFDGSLLNYFFTNKEMTENIETIRLFMRLHPDYHLLYETGNTMINYDLDNEAYDTKEIYTNGGFFLTLEY